MIAFIDAHRSRFGVEPICQVLRQQGVGIAPSTYYAAKTRPPSARALADLQLVGEIARVHGSRDLCRGVYVSGEVWLSEHFRSMPEIIEYSNKLCYADHRLQPVRQYGRDRLDPL